MHNLCYKLCYISNRINFIISQFNNITFFEEGWQFHKRRIIPWQRGPVPDDDELGLGPGHGHIESPGVEEDVPRPLAPAIVAPGARVDDDKLVPALILVHCADLHTRVCRLQLGLRSKIGVVSWEGANVVHYLDKLYLRRVRGDDTYLLLLHSTSDQLWD